MHVLHVTHIRTAPITHASSASHAPDVLHFLDLEARPLLAQPLLLPLQRRQARLEDLLLCRGRGARARVGGRGQLQRRARQRRQRRAPVPVRPSTQPQPQPERSCSRRRSAGRRTCMSQSSGCSTASPSPPPRSAGSAWPGSGRRRLVALRAASMRSRCSASACIFARRSLNACPSSHTCKGAEVDA